MRSDMSVPVAEFISAVVLLAAACAELDWDETMTAGGVPRRSAGNDP